ncbi:MAG: histidine phosphatase family protein [Burkholderiaceae bacterium]|jgi:probable phosphoglycerate mutase
MSPREISPPRRRIYLMRHGSVSYYEQGKPRIESTAAVLNDAGRFQATSAGIAFAHAGVHFDRVIVSGLPRTVETAQRLLFETRQKIALESWPELAELRSGPLDPIPLEDLRDAVVGAFEGVVPPEKRFAGGESIGELLDRVHPAIDRLRADPHWQIALLVLHGGVNRAILSLALTGQRMFLGNISQAPACINALDVGGAANDWVIRYMGVAPTDLLQAEARQTTIEALLMDYLKTRPPASPGTD